MTQANGGFKMTSQDKERYRSLSPSQRIMVDDGMPVSLMLTQEERRQWWIDHPPTGHTNAFVFRAPDAHLREAQEALAAARRKERFEHLKATRAPREPSINIQIRAQLVDVATVAQEFGLEPRVARAMLRKASFPKPVWGWAFNDDQLARVRQILTMKEKASGEENKKRRHDEAAGGAQRVAQAAGHGADRVDNQPGRAHRNTQGAHRSKRQGGKPRRKK